MDPPSLITTLTTPLSDTFSQRKQNAGFLASQYTQTKRAGEIACVLINAAFLLVTAYQVGKLIEITNIWLIVVACILAMVMADLFSGLVHWAADTWGNLNTPLVGKTFIRSFREHHVDPFRITCHDLFETNGDNCMLTIPVLFILVIDMHCLSGENGRNLGTIFLICFLAFLCLWVSLTNQIHKWAHMLKPPRFVAFLQDYGVILPRKNHQIHHHTPFDRYYCITTGWLNAPLQALDFWRRMDIAITTVTGVAPRQDDAYWTVQTPASKQK